MNLARRFDGSCTTSNRPRTSFHRPGRKKAHEVEHGVSILDKAIAGRLLEPKVSQKHAALFLIELGDVHLDLATDGHHRQLLTRRIFSNFFWEWSVERRFIDIVDH